MPFTRGARAAGNRVANWDVRQSYAYPDPAQANDIILTELERGVTSLHIVFDQAAMAGLDADQPGADRLAGADGMMIYSVDDLDRLLTGVYLDLDHGIARCRRAVPACRRDAPGSVEPSGDRRRRREGCVQRRSARHARAHRLAAGLDGRGAGAARGSGPPHRRRLAKRHRGGGRYLALSRRRRHGKSGSGDLDGDGRWPT